MRNSLNKKQKMVSYWNKFNSNFIGAFFLKCTIFKNKQKKKKINRNKTKFRLIRINLLKFSFCLMGYDEFHLVYNSNHYLKSMHLRSIYVLLNVNENENENGKKNKPKRLPKLIKLQLQHVCIWTTIIYYTNTWKCIILSERWRKKYIIESSFERE